jgi:hypothetical protein
MAKMWTLFILVMGIQALAASSYLIFLTEDKLEKISTGLEKDRISPVLSVHYSLALIKMQIKAAAKHLKTVQTAVD